MTITQNLKYISPLTGKPCKTKPTKLLKLSQLQKQNRKEVTEKQRKWRQTHPEYMPNWKKINNRRQLDYVIKSNHKYQDKMKTRNMSKAANYPRADHCELCGSQTKLEAHHFDYSKPFEFITLCEACHKKQHLKAI